MEEYLEKFVPLIKPSRGFKELKSLVIDTGMCSRCGTCVAFCDRIVMGKEAPELKSGAECTLDMGSLTCGQEGTCYDHCPHISYSMLELDERIFGEARKEEIGCYKKVLAVRSKIKEILERAQDGGAATSLVLFALENGYADGAIVVGRSDNWDTSSLVVRERKDLFKTGGTKYVKTPSTTKIGEALRGEIEEAEKLGKLRKLVMVGTGCQITGARKLQYNLLKDVPNVELILIGLFCYENFLYECLKERIKALFGLGMKEVEKTDITGGKFIITTKDGDILKKSVKLFDECVNDACNLCTNFTSTFSDVSIGSVGSKKGWSTVIIRSERGLELVNKAVEKGYIEISDEVDIEEPRKLTSLKIKKRDETAKKRREKGLYIPEYA